MRTLDQPALFLSAMELLGRHRLVPFIVLEEGGMFGDRALALLMSEIDAEFGAHTGKLPVNRGRNPDGPPARALMLPLPTGCASGSAEGLWMASGHHV